jgi:hypothetical protein
MPVYLSPGVFSREIDLSAVPASGSGIIPAFIGTAQRGPVNTPTFVTSASEFIETFGEPFVDSNLGYAVLTYMEEGNNAWVLRAGVECEEGQVDALASICIDTSGARVEGWGRVPLFTGIDFGKIRLRTPSADEPYEFHDSSTTTPEYTDLDVSGTDGPTVASMTVTGDYEGSVDDVFTTLITSPPDAGEVIIGAGYEIIRQSDGVVVASGLLADANTDDTSDAIEVGTGDDASGLSVEITVTGSSPLEQDDTFTFSAVPDNRNFQFAVEGVEGAELSMSAATYTDPDAFVTAFNLVAAAEDYQAVNILDEVWVRTVTAGERIQLIGNSGGTSPETEGFALEVGTTKWAWDIPRSYLIGGETDPVTITTQNDRVAIDVIGSDSTANLEFTLPTSLSMPISTLATHVHIGGVQSGTRYYEAFALQVTNSTERLVMVATSTNQFDQLKLLSNASHIETQRFADEVQIPFPFTRGYRGFSDARVAEPDGGIFDPEIPLSCEDNPSGSDCLEDTAYFQNIVGFVVAKTPGTWIDNYTFSLENFNGEGGRYTILIRDLQGNLDSRVDDVSFDPDDERYIANVINAGSAIGGQNGDEWIEWVERDANVGADEIRLPGLLNEVSFEGTANGIPTDAAYSGNLDAAIIGRQNESSGIYAFSDPDTYDITLLSVPGNSSGSVIGTMLQVSEGRGDCMAVIDPPFGLRPQQVVDWHNGMLSGGSLSAAVNSSFGALYWGWVKIFDQFSAQEVFIPPSGHVTAVFARTEREAESWFAPAGLNRGRLLTALDAEYEGLSRGERDLLYGFNNAINPIAKFPQEGLVVWGQRTLQRKDSALDRVNVRMLLIHIKKVLIPLLRNFLFEQNDEFLWAQVRSAIRPVLSDIAARRGLTGFKVVVDASNNTPARVDRNELHVSVFVKPTKVAEFIQLDLAILRSDQLFSSEAVLAAAGIVTS